MKIFGQLLLKYLVICLPIYGSIIVLVNKYESASYTRQVSALSDNARHDLTVSSTGLQYKLNTVINELAFLSEGFDYRSLNDPTALQQIASTFYTLSRTTDQFDQIRFLDTAGQEIIRVNQTPDGPELVAPEKLQNKASRYYVNQLLESGKNELYVSQFDLNVENNKIEIPYKPVIRLGLPVFSGSTRIGMVLINYLGQSLLDDLSQAPNYQVMLVNQGGYWLKAPDKKDEWGFQLGTDRSFKKNFPRAWQVISNQESGTVTSPEGIFIFQDIHPFAPGETHQCLLPDHLPCWTLIHHIPASTLDSVRAATTRAGLLNKLLISGCLLLVTVILAGSRARMLKAARAVEKSEHEYHDLFENMINGFALHEMIFDENHNPIDYRFLKVNKAFEEMTGLRAAQVVGRTVKEVLPSVESYWVQKYGEVVISGRSTRFENYSQELDKYFEVWAYKVSRSEFVAVIQDVTLSRHAREALEKQAKELQSIFDTTGSGLLLTKTDARILDTNQAFENLLGYSRKELIGKSYIDFVPEELRSDTLQRLKLLQAGQNIDEAQVQALTKEGQLLTLLINAHPVFDEQNKVTSLVISATDITRLKKTKAEAKALAERLQLATRAAKLGVWDWDVQNNVLTWDSGMYELYGISKEDFSNAYEAWQQCLHPADLERARLETEAALQGERNFNSSFRIILPDGSVRHLRALADVYHDKEGNPIRMIGMNWDITQLKLAEEERNINAQRYRFLSNAAHEAVVLCRNGKIREANQRFYQLTGKTEEEVQDGLELNQILDPRALRVDETVTLNLDLIEAPGYKPLLAEVSLMQHDFLGESVDVLVIRDVSAQKETEEMLILAKMRAEAANRTKSEFLTTMSHELRTPMNGIMGMTQLLQDTELSEDQREYTDIIYSSSQSLLEIINDLLDLAGIENGKIHLRKKPLNLRDTAAQIVELLTPQARKKDLELAFTYDAALPHEFIGDEGRIRQILLNLMGNALKFTDAGCVRLAVRIEALSSEGFLVRIEVNDTGIGIPQEKIDTIFEKFTQVDQSHTRRYEGAGLGLHITKRLVELMDGTLSCESVVDQGSTFTVILPLPHLTDEPEKDTCHIAHLDHPLKVLLAEDNLPNRMTAEQLLQKMGCTTVNAGNGKEVLELAIEQPFDLILMDIKMPEMDGLETTAQLRAAGITTPIIAVTAHAMTSDKQACLAAGMNDYLAKPIDQKTLFEALSKITKE